MNKVLISLTWETFISDPKFRWLSLSLYMFFFFFFKEFYLRNYLYTHILWQHIFFSNYFSESDSLFFYTRSNSDQILANYKNMQFFLDLKINNTKLYVPGNVYIFKYQNSYFLLSLYLRGSVSSYNFLKDLHNLRSQKNSFFYANYNLQSKFLPKNFLL